MGVTEYLNKFIDENGDPLFPIFTPDNYWDRRFTYWGDESQDVTKEYDPETGTGVYTVEERELIFGNETPTRLNND